VNDNAAGLIKGKAIERKHGLQGIKHVGLNDGVVPDDRNIRIRENGRVLVVTTAFLCWEKPLDIVVGDFQPEVAILPNILDVPSLIVCCKTPVKEHDSAGIFFCRLVIRSHDVRQSVIEGVFDKVRVTDHDNLADGCVFGAVKEGKNLTDCNRGSQKGGIVIVPGADGREGNSRKFVCVCQD